MPAVAVVTDGKAGHVNQSLGLAEALQRLQPGLALREVPRLAPAAALAGFAAPARLGQHGAAFANGPDPVGLLIGAGHRTHLTLLALRRAWRCPAVVLMRPSLPGRFFDLRIEPRHDGGRESDRCWLSDGPLNRIVPAAKGDAGLILIGGPSPHFAWDSAAILGQLGRICDGTRTWRLTTSRRTPADFLPALRALDLAGLEAHDAAELPSAWLGEHLPRAELCWSTPDSASMVYEALTAGCGVGVFDLPALGGSRVAAAVRDLTVRGLATSFEAFAGGAPLRPPAEPFAEADRCARRLVERGWL